MQNRRDLLEEIELVQTLKMVSQAYEEISAMKMQKIRDSVLRTRDFLTRLSEVFYDVKRSHKKMLSILSKEIEVEDLSPFSLLPRNGKTLSVLLSANEKMNGDILMRVFMKFVHHLEKNQDDILIIGRVGREYFQQYGLGRGFMYFEIPDNEVKVEDIKQIIYQLVNYEEINVFYGKFTNIINQEPVISNISGDRPIDPNLIDTPVVDEKQKDANYLFEPSLEELHNFFETQFFTSLFKQTIHESQLSRYASRIKAMEDALGNIETRRKNLYSDQRKLKKLTMNNKQIGTVAGIALWDS